MGIFYSHCMKSTVTYPHTQNVRTLNQKSYGMHHQDTVVDRPIGHQILFHEIKKRQMWDEWHSLYLLLLLRPFSLSLSLD